MMNPLRLLLSLGLTLLLSVTTLTAQSGNFWYFGNQAGIDFNTNPPTAVVGQLDTQEGVATISDNNGNLLFYTDGSNVWDPAGLIVNAATLNGDNSATQSAVVVSDPADASAYYLFTVGATEVDATRGRFEYTRVLTGNGIVSMDPNFMPPTSLLGGNNAGSGEAAEKIAVIPQCDGNGFWVITHDNGNTNAFGDRFYAYSVTNTGVNAVPVITSVGQVHSAPYANNSTNAVGYMRSSPNGTQIALVYRGTNSIYLYDFDSNTGTVSNETQVSMPAAESIYGLEFSPDGGQLYIGGSNTVYRVTTNNPGVPVAVTVDNGGSLATVRALQQGPDGQIYISQRNSSVMATIFNPNANNSTINPSFLSLQRGTNCRFGLPTFAAALSNDQVMFDWQQPDCLSPEVVFDGQTSAMGTVTWNWNFGDGNTSIQEDPTHTYSESGSYEVSLSLTNGNGCVFTHTEIVVVESCSGCENLDATAGFTFDANCLEVTFTDISQLNSTSANWSFTEWNLGYQDSDGNDIIATTGTNSTITHSFPENGTYDVCVTMFVYTPEGECCRFTYCETITVAEGCSCIPYPSLDVSYSVCSVNECCIAATFINNADYAPDFVIWNWGDTVTIEDNPDFGSNHVYDDPGSYLVSVSAVYCPDGTNLCCEVVAEISIPVNCRYIASMEKDKKEQFAIKGIAPNPIQLSASSTLSLQHSKVDTDTPLDITVINLAGQVVLNQSTPAIGKQTHMELPVSLPAGVYLVQVRIQTGESFTSRFVVVD